MGMGGGGGGSVPPAGLSPLQKEQFSQGQQLIDTNIDMTKVMQNRVLAMEGMQDKLRRSNADLARGGLMIQGMRQVNQGLSQGPDMNGVMARSAARLGVAASPEQQAAMDSASAITRASTQIGVRNQARQGLAGAQQDMRFAGY